MAYTSDDSDQIRETARNVFARKYDFAFLRSFHEQRGGSKTDLIAFFREMGWHGLFIPESFGGYGFGFPELCVLLEEMGRAAFPPLYFSTYVIPTLALSVLHESDLKRNILSDISERKSAVCLAADTSTIETFCEAREIVASHCHNGYELAGCVHFLGDIDAADQLLIPGRLGDGRVLLFCTSAKSEGLSITRQQDTNLPNTFSIALDDTPVPQEQVLASDVAASLEKAFQMCQVAKSAEMIGSAQRALEFAVEHILTRKQFGKYLAEFQAVQHQAANIFVDLEVSKLLLNEAIGSIIAMSDFSLQAHMCKSWANDACFNVTKTSHQLMGGVGYMSETNLHFLTLNVLRAQYEFGSSMYIREAVADQLGL